MKSLLIILLLTPSFTFSQFFLGTETDSIVLKILDNSTKEMVIAESDIQLKILKSQLLEPMQTSKINKFFTMSGVLKDEHALLTHHNLEFNTYVGGKQKSQVLISTLSHKVSYIGLGDFYSKGLTRKGVKKLKKILKSWNIDKLISQYVYFPKN